MENGQLGHEVIVPPKIEASSGLLGERDLSDAEFIEIMTKLSEDTPLVDTARFNELVQNFRHQEQLDTLEAVLDFANCSSEAAALFRGDLGLLRPCRGVEHAFAVVDGFEQDYQRLFADDPEALAILRLTALIQDAGKALSVKAMGSSRHQAFFNDLVTDNLLAHLPEETLAADAKEVVRQVLGQDIIGHSLRGTFDQAKLDKVRGAWPARFADSFDDFMLTAYLCDASAHSVYRNYIDLSSGEAIPCVTDNDEHLSHLFEKADGQPLTLTQPYRQVLAQLFGQARRLAPYFTSEPLPPHEQQTYQPAGEAAGTWSAELRLPSAQPFADVKQMLEDFAMQSGFSVTAFARQTRGGVRSVTLTRHPSSRATPAAPSPEECQAAAQQLQEITGWELQDEPPTDKEFRVCVGLEEGYTHEVQHLPAEALAILLAEDPNNQWRTVATTLISARRDINEAGQPKLKHYSEQVMLIEGRHSPAVVNLASRFKQDRIFLDDYQAKQTRALKQAPLL